MIKHSLSILTLSCLACTSVQATERATIQGDLANGFSAMEKQGDGTLNDMHIISNKHPNRIVTPFSTPVPLLDKFPDTDWKVKGNVVYISTKLSNVEIGGFIKEKGDEGSAIRVILKPMPVPPQEVVLKGQRSYGSKVAREFEQSNFRNSTIVNVLSTLARGELPEGYSITSIPHMYMPYGCYQKGLEFDFSNGQLSSGGDYVVAIGTVTNNSTRAIQYDVSNCFRQEGVIANSSYPHDVLFPSQTSEAFVMFYRDKPVAKKTPQRKSLLGE